jgi:hypothetical protein
MMTLRSFDNFPGFQAAGADFDPFARAVDQRAHRLQIGIKAAARAVVCVGNVIAELRAFPADFTTMSHNYLRNFSGYLLGLSSWVIFSGLSWVFQLSSLLKR